MNLEALPKDQTYLVGVSGGHDSVALLEHLLREGFTALVACHLNHALRGAESDADEEFVQTLASSRGIACEVLRCDVAAEAKRDRLSLEAAGRRARLRFFVACGLKHSTSRLFLAHHADDQAETVLLNLLRGTGLAGLAGMAEVAFLESLTVYRPFLSLRKRELPPPSAFREDSSNLSAGHLRNRLRQTVLPALDAALQHDPVPSLLRLSHIAAQEDGLLGQLAQEAAEQVREGPQLKTPELKLLHPALQRRILHRWLLDQGVTDCGFQEVESIRSLLLHTGPDHPAQINLPGNRHVRRREKRLWILE